MEPSITSNLQIDLTSFNLPQNSINATLNDVIVTAFRYDTPLNNVVPSVYRFNGTGYLSSESNVSKENMTLRDQ
jgi:hypothetical protein